MTLRDVAARRSWPLTLRIFFTVLLSIACPPIINLIFLFAVPLQDVRIYSARWLVDEVVQMVRLVESVSVEARSETLARLQQNKDLAFENLADRSGLDKIDSADSKSSSLQGFADILQTEITRRFQAEGRVIVVTSREPSAPLPPPVMRVAFDNSSTNSAPFRYKALQLGEGDVPIPSVFNITVQLKDGTWLSVKPSPSNDWVYFRVMFTVVLIFSLLGALIYLISRSLTRPLQALGSAVENFGERYVAEPVPPLGIAEYDRIAAKFNQLQVQIAAYLRERNQMIGAISHDLRTPLTRLRLFAEYLEDAEIRRNAIASVDDMQMMIEDTLSYARGMWSHEEKVKSDLAVMLSTEVDAQVDLGRNAQYYGPDHLPFACFPVSLRRAFANLIENGIKYGKSVGVTLTANTKSVSITVADQGVGFAPESAAIALSPFERLEASRNRSTGGIGLGLTIADDVIKRHGGSLSFRQLPGGRGFEACVVLPMVHEVRTQMQTQHSLRP